MMSYLWILLLGSLLATSAKAQEEEAAPENPSLDPAAVPEVNAEPEETDQTAEEIQPSAPESNAEPEAGAEQPAEDTEPAAPATEDAEPAAPAAEDTEPAAPAAEDADPATPATEDTEPAAPATEDTEAAAPAAEDTEPAAPAAEDTEAAAPAAEDTEAAAPAAEDTEAAEATPAAADTEADAAATTEEPAADPEVKDPEAEQPKENAEEESTAGSDMTVAPVESGTDDEATPTADVAAEDNQEQPTDPDADAKPEVAIVEENILPEVRTGVRAFVPSDKEEGAAPVNAAPVAGTKEDEKPQAQEASSSSLAGILCGIAVAAVGSVVGYFTYRKKKLCFKNRQEADPEAARKANTAEANSDPQVLSNLLNSS